MTISRTCAQVHYFLVVGVCETSNAKLTEDIIAAAYHTASGE
jgi:hypothetical protein